MHRYFPLMIVGLIGFLCACKENQQDVKSIFKSNHLVNANTQLLNIAMEDGFPPPIAARVYVYPHIAHYITLSTFYPDSLRDLRPILNGLNGSKIETEPNADPALSSLLAFCGVAKKVVFSEHLVDDLKNDILSIAKSNGFSNTVIAASVLTAENVTKSLSKWIDADNYIQTRTMDRWTSAENPANWRETPPDYQVALEPHWHKMRTLVIDSPGVYKPNPVPNYSPEKSSEFYKMVEQVYLESKNLDSSKIATAWYWDDNPNSSEHRGHAVAIIHKISPPGHWLSIISGIIGTEKYSILKATEAYTLSAIAMYDSIIASWYQKYKSNLVRPISYIQEYIDVDWTPLIQTPPFPEFTSGHSAISASAAIVLTNVIGADYNFTDSTQVQFGMEPRYYASFEEAAWEVSLSRFYGGIHYMNGVEEGNKQGKTVANNLLNKLNDKLLIK